MKMGRSAEIQVSILYFAGCPHHGTALALTRGIVQRLGVRAIIREVRVRDLRDAARLRFPGSPTIRVNGRDIVRGQAGHLPVAFACRLYDGSPTPPAQLIEAALREAVAELP